MTTTTAHLDPEAVNVGDVEETGNGLTRERAAEVAATVAGGVRDVAGNVAGTVAARLPEAAAATRATVDEANRRMQAGSDEMLLVGSAMAFGYAAGLLTAGAPRVLVMAAVVPAVAMGMTLLDRSGRSTAGRTAR